MDLFKISQDRDNFHVEALVCPMGNDILVVLSGGVSHIGAVAMAQPRPSLQDPQRTSATSSVFTFPGHREDVVVKAMSEELSGRLNRRSVIVAGLHWDGLQKKQIEIVLEMCREITEKIIAEAEKK